ncbi:MAG: c-type cytochrome [Cyclobacteriaceae bacterium]|nr:c-type cytochrome [Cyclobacteriaceae bacterium]
MRIKAVGSIFLLASALLSCTPDEQPDYTPTAYDLKIPKGFPAMEIPDDNPMTVEGIELGRMLYYDSILDQNQSRACATCHVQEHSFTSVPDVLPHVNLGWSYNWLWKGDVQGSLEDIMEFEVQHFFFTNLDNLKSDAAYLGLFKKAFGTDEITYQHIEMALAQFLRTLNSGNAKFDKVQRGEAQFTNQENLGFELFFTERGDCFHCHATAFFTDGQLHNNALDTDPDPGHFDISGDPLDFGKYKSPTLRNIEYTAPYMHDGRFATLEEVVNFYSEGLQPSPTVDPLMKQLSNGGVQLSEDEKAALVAFLKTLSDEEFVQNPEFSRNTQ